MGIHSFSNWRTSSRSGGGDSCVEVAFATDGTVGVRDSKNPTGSVLEFTPGEWETVLGGARDGESDQGATTP